MNNMKSNLTNPNVFIRFMHGLGRWFCSIGKSLWKWTKSVKPYQWVSYAFIIILGLFMLYPMYYALLGSVATIQEFDQTVFLPKAQHVFSQLKNYILVFKSDGLLSSLIITASRIVLYFIITVFTSVLGGYVFAKVNFPFKRTFFIILMSSMMIPGVALMVPNYVWMAKFPLVGGNDINGLGGRGFIDNIAFLFVTGWINVYNIFLCRQALMSVGDDINESAQIDGANFLKIVFGMYMPLIKPILAVMFLNLFLGMWNDYMTNLIYLPNSPDLHHVGSVFVRLIEYYTNPFLYGGADYPKAFAISIVSMIPPIIVYIFMQKSFVEGLAMGGVKG